MAAPRSYDVIVIGAGSVGTPAALSLSEAGLRTLVLDERPSVGQGSNKRAIGGLRATHSDAAKIRVSLRSLEVFSTWEERYGDKIEWHKGGYSFVAYRKEEEDSLKALLPFQKTHGLRIDWLDRKQLLEAVPDLNPNGLIGGTLAPDDGNASPLLAIQAFYRRARSLGADFKFNEKVTGLIMAGGKVTGVRTDRGEYGAPAVINAAGPNGAEVARLSGLEIPVRPDSHEAAVTEAVARFLEPMIVDIRPVAGSANYYFYQHDTGQIIFCITPSPPIWGQDVRETSSFLPMVAKRMIEVIPRLKNIRVRRTWRGLYPMTPDGLPIVGETREVPGFILAVGMCGQGFMLGPGLGELLGRLVQGKLSDEDRDTLAYFSPYRKFKDQEKLG
ncbi:MAG: putative oxidoreductase [Candidatus Aminicenantes bacterium]|nr:putative oxidoreductase [Candidatus Aminicenantes bacterium]